MFMRLVIISIFLSVVFCKAQDIANLYSGELDLPPGTYYKDLDNDLPKFVGLWEMNNGNEIVQVRLLLQERFFDGEYYFDEIYGEYSYAVNGDELVNTMPNLNNTSMQLYYHNISAVVVIPRDAAPKCPECGPFERRLNLSFDDPEREYIPAQVAFRYRVVNGEEQLLMKIIGSGAYKAPFENAPDDLRLPIGDYVLTKVE